MAKKNEVNKPQAVCDFLKANKKARNEEVVAALAIRPFGCWRRIAEVSAS
jgi:hypothetical protein